MPRRARVYIPGLPYHIVQRGNNRQACFVVPGDYAVYLDLWRTVSRRYGVTVHAYCLMTNHVHFLATPQQDTSLSETMKVVGSRYAHYINRRYARTGTLWEGRHRSSLVQSERYLICCYRYVELNPVRAGIVRWPEEYQWSSYRANAWGEPGIVSGHELYLALGKTQIDRCAAYRELFKAALDHESLQLIRAATHYCQPVGSERFRREIESQYGIKAGRMNRGRPRKIGTGELAKI